MRLFAAAAEAAGGNVVDVSLGESATAGELVEAVCEARPGLRPLAGSLLVAVDQSYVGRDAVLPAAGEIACFPPVSGG